MKTSSTSNKILEMVQISFFAAIICLMASVPFLGYIPLGVINATTIHIPVILGAILLGPKAGAILGFVFGATSLLRATFVPTVTSFLFSPFYSVGEIHGDVRSLIICFVPRILIGIVSYYVYQFLCKLLPHTKTKRSIALIGAGLAGSITNTLLVMNLVYFLFGQTYAAVNNIAINMLYSAIVAIIVGSGIPEAIVASVITVAVGSILIRLNLGRTNNTIRSKTISEH